MREKRLINWLNKHKKKIPIVILFLVILSLMLYFHMSGFFLANWTTKAELKDINDDGIVEECVLKNRKFTIFHNGETIWKSKEEWKVENYLLGDINDDGYMDILLLCWKRGSFGEHRPFWVEKDDTSYSQHIFIFSVTEKGIGSIWMSSELKPELKKWEMHEDGTMTFVSKDGESMLWGWEGWGLVRLDGEVIIL